MMERIETDHPACFGSQIQKIYPEREFRFVCISKLIIA